MKYITGLEINTSDIPQAVTTRTFAVTGDEGAVFSIQAKDSSGKFYNFKTQKS